MDTASVALADRWAQQELAALERAGLRRLLEPLDSPQGSRVRVAGRSLVNFSSNDYLGLASDPRLAEAAREALLACGVGAGASRLLVGDTPWHHSLEHALARLEGTQAALLFGTGYAANLGVLSALLGPEDAVFSDALNHASIIDGCRLSRARVRVYRHADPAHLDALLSSEPARRRLVVTESVFSMDGDRAPLLELSAVAARHGAALMVDEAHATGVVGPKGAGCVVEAGLSDQVELRVGTLGKALGAFGAYVATSDRVRELLLNRARSLVYSTSLPALVCAAAQRAVELMSGDEVLRGRLWRNIRLLATGLRELGLPAAESSAIFPVVLGAPEHAVLAAARLREKGFLVKAVRPPTVPEGTSRLRISVSAAHTEQELAGLLSALGELEVHRVPSASAA